MNSDAYLLHQVHPGKLATDITAGVASTVLMWQRRIPAALTVGHVPPLVASAVVIRCELSDLRDTRRGRYVLVHMPPAAQAVRLLGQIMAWRAAYHHRPVGIAAGIAVIIAGWSFGALRGSTPADTV